MSSEGSVSSSGSRIRQFGLYRTIDARTEEFLRSSRKRQIRQGCACAAISTAITVTVVVSVILVYEYSINSESNVNKKISLKPNWFGLMNESDITSFDSKFNKKINFDRTTLKLLPILLKALNKNRYLEKILEDYSSSSPPYVGKDSTEDTFKRNVFSDAKNWLKMPTSKHYSIDYKTSPLIYWKSPTQRLEYLTKIRKIRDYQRMLKYFDKMINEKVGSNQKRDFEYTENPLIAKTAPMKLEKNIKIHQNQYPLEIKNNGKNDKEGMVSCKCPKKLGQLLNKLIVGIQDMIPHSISKKQNINTCINGTKSIPRPHNFTTHRTVVQVTKPRNTELPAVIPKRSIQKVTTIPPKHTPFTRKSTTKSTTTSTSTTTTLTTTRSTTSSTARTTTRSIASSSAKEPVSETPHTTEIKRTYFEDSTIPIPTLANTLLPYYQIYERNTLDYDSIVRPTDVSYIETARSQPTKPAERSTTEMFVPIKFIDSSNEASNTEKIHDDYTLEPSDTRTTVPLFKEEDYDDYYVTTSKINKDLENLDVPSFELVKTKIKTPLNNEFKSPYGLKKMTMNTKPLNFHPVIKHKDLDLASMRKMADMIYFPHEKIGKLANKKLNMKPTVALPSIKNEIAQELRSMNTNAKITNSVESNTSLTSTKFTSSIKNSIKITSSESDIKLEPLEMKLGMDQTNIDNVGEEEFQDEYGYKQMETRIPYEYKNTTEKNKTKSETEKENQNLSSRELSKNEEKVSGKSPKSMLPPMRTSYLEVQRNNEWRQDEHDHADYDINFNNNIFDLPNIN